MPRTAQVRGRNRGVGVCRGMMTVARPSPRSSALSAHTGRTQTAVSAANKPIVAASSVISMKIPPGPPSPINSSEEPTRNDSCACLVLAVSMSPGEPDYSFARHHHVPGLHRVERTLARATRELPNAYFVGAATQYPVLPRFALFTVRTQVGS